MLKDKKGKVMQRALILAAVVIGLGSAAHAQQSNPEMVIARQLLSEATDRVITLGAQLGSAQTEIARLKAEIEKAKAAEKPK